MSMKHVRPLYDKILVQRVEEETKTASGIIIPDTAKEKPMQAKVIAVGKGVKDDKGQLQSLEVKVGDNVLFAKWGGTEVKINGQEYLIIKEGDVLAIVE